MFRVACVIPSHRRPAWLGEALASALAQTVPPDEIFVCDDEGSPEAADVVAKEAARAPMPVRYLAHGDGRGPSTSRNAGARAASCEWLAFLDDDDRWLPRYLETALAANADLVLTARWDFGEDQRRTPGKSPLPQYDERRWLRRNLGGTGSSTVIRRSLFLAAGGYDPALYSGQDRDLILRAMRVPGARYAAVSERLLEHRDVGARISRDARTILPARLRFLWKHLGDMNAGDVAYMLRKIVRETRRASWR